MNPLEFTEQEKDLMRPCIKKRHEYLKSWYKSRPDEAKRPGSYLTRIEKITSEINQHQTYLAKKDKALLAGIIKEHLIDPNQEKIILFKREINNLNDKEEAIFLNLIIGLFNKLVDKNLQRSLI